MMSNYIQTLADIKESINKGKELSVGYKMIVIDLIAKEEQTHLVKQDVFIYFYEDAIRSKIAFDFKTELTESVYTLAQDDAQNCVNTFSSINKLEENSSLHVWLQNAIKFTDHLALHYLQVIIKEIPIKQGSAGKERSRYIQINQKKNDAERAGRILDNLYECRNKMEHRTESDPNNPDFQKISPPNYKTAKKQIQRRYPEALICFQESFLNYHK